MLKKVECFKTYRLQSIGFCDYAYFSLDEVDLVKELAKQAIDKGIFDLEVKKLRISKSVLDGHIRDRKQWERI